MRQWLSAQPFLAVLAHLQAVLHVVRSRGRLQSPRLIEVQDSSWNCSCSSFMSSFPCILCTCSLWMASQRGGREVWEGEAFRFSDPNFPAEVRNKSNFNSGPNTSSKNRVDSRVDRDEDIGGMFLVRRKRSHGNLIWVAKVPTYFLARMLSAHRFIVLAGTFRAGNCF